MEIEQLMARARHRAHYTQARERKRIEKQRQRQSRNVQRPAEAEAAILKFAAASAARVSAQGTQVLLPDSVLDMVMAKLASCLEPGGVYGPSLVARDLANASLVCTEFCCAAQFGFSALNSNIQQSLQQQLLRQPLPPPPSAYLGIQLRQAHNTAAALSTGMNLPGPKGWHFWDVLVTEPLALQLSELETAAQQMGIVDLVPAPAAAAAAGGAPGAAAHRDAADAAAAVQVDRQYAAGAESAAAGAAARAGAASLAGAAAAAQKAISNSSNKHKASVVSKLLACFGLIQPLPVASAAAEAQALVLAGSSPNSPPAAAAAAAGPASSSGAATTTGGRAALLRAVTLERCCPIIAGDGPDKCAGLLAAVRQLSELGYKPAVHAQAYNGLRGCLAKVRTELEAAGVGSKDVLMELLQQQRDAAAAKQQQERQRQRQRGVPGKRCAGAAAAAARGSVAVKRSKSFSLSSVSIRPLEKDHVYCD